MYCSPPTKVQGDFLFEGYWDNSSGCFADTTKVHVHVIIQPAELHVVVKIKDWRKLTIYVYAYDWSKEH